MTHKVDDLRKQIYGLSFAIETHPDDFVLRIDQKGVDKILALIKLQQEALLAKVEAELPYKRLVIKAATPSQARQMNIENQCLDQVKTTINKLRLEL